MAYTCPFCKSTNTKPLRYVGGETRMVDGVQRPIEVPHSEIPTQEYVCYDCGQVTKTIRLQ